jgi:hypothetical protein
MKTLPKLLLSLAAALCAQGCATPVWNRPGGTPAEFYKVSRQCMTESGMLYGSLSQPPGVGERYNLCLQRQGWQCSRLPMPGCKSPELKS